MIPFLLFPTRFYQVALIILFGALLFTCYRRAEHFDDAWFAEQSYWLVRDGWVRSELFRGQNGWEDRIYVFHKLFIYVGAAFMRVAGFSLAASKLLTTSCGIAAGWLIWQYGRRGTRQQQWLAVILYFGCGTIIRYFSVNRPEIMCMLLGFGSYIALDRLPGKHSGALLAGGLAGLAALTHLNGLIYLVAGGIWLIVRAGWQPAIRFSLIGGLTLSLYAVDALVDGRFDMMIRQFIDDPATQSNFKLTDKLMVMVNYHQLFFHSHNEISLSVLALLCLLVFRRTVQFTQPVLQYLASLIVAFWLLTKSNFDFYYILFVPWLAILTATCMTAHLPEQPVWQRRVGQGLLIGYFGFSLFSIGNALVENYTQPYVPSYNSVLAQHMPRHQTKIIAPISFFFGQMDTYKIHGLSYYSALNNRAPLPLDEFFRRAEREHVEYVVSDGFLNASYLIPLNAPARIGAYQRIFQDGLTSIYQRQ